MIDQLYYHTKLKSFSMQSSSSFVNTDKRNKLLYEKKEYDMLGHFVRFIEMYEAKFKKKSDFVLWQVNHEWYNYWSRYSMETSTIKDRDWKEIPTLEKALNR